MANNFRWFNEPGRNLLSPSNEGDPNVVGYQPSQEGALSILGRTLQGIAAPFAGDYQFNQRQAQQELMQQKADQEFQALLMKNAMTRQEDLNQRSLRNAQANALNAQAEYFRNSGNAQDGGINGINYPYPEDITLTPKNSTYKGMVRTTLVPELKDKVGQSQLKDLAEVDSTVSDLQKNMDTLKKYGFQSGPGYATSTLPGADIYSQFTKSKEFNTWKSDTGRAFQKYRKWATGVAAGYPELQMIAPNFPKVTDKPDVYTSKSISAVDDMNRNKQMFLDYLSKAGYRTGELRGNRDVGVNQSGKLNKDNLFDGL